MKYCITCLFHKSRSSKIPGKKIPHGTGKCLRASGPCEEYVPAGKIGETQSILVQNGVVHK